MSWNRKAVGLPADVAKEIDSHAEIPLAVKQMVLGVAAAVKPDAGLYVETSGHIDGHNVYCNAVVRIEVVPLAKADG